MFLFSTFLHTGTGKFGPDGPSLDVGPHVISTISKERSVILTTRLMKERGALYDGMFTMNNASLECS